ncbi:Coatomer, beta' subunit [Hesseltinella vesiculosa]|uniref:Beta'-coat protein n=1 Tax=Hesseltinella vesiculosa TaxID=101127 RepID=A0A1X2G345_9FUNG|nr:Coatomer, beta' subunit [Hesseltinella vesiculosa]
MRLDIKRKLLSRSDRVKCVDLHPTEPWVLASLYSGHVYIYNYETQVLVKTFEVSETPGNAFACCKFIARKNWIVTGSDDSQIRIFNYNTHEKVASFEGHPIISVVWPCIPHNPWWISGSDDMTIRLWDWEKGWKCVQVFEGHLHFVMHLTFNPKDSNTFASAGLDGVVKVWSLGANVPNFTLEGHEKGVNFVDYYHGGDKPYLISCADDKRYVRVWHSDTYRLENTLNYGLERAWCMAYQKGGNNVAFGFDEGTVVIKLGRDEPAISMDASGKIIWAKHSEIQTANIKTGVDDYVKDGDRLALPIKELGSCEVYPQTLQHSPNGRFVLWLWLGLCVAEDSNIYAVHESSSRVKIFKNFKERSGMLPKLNYSAEGIHGGSLLGVRGSGFLNFYDWETGAVVRRIDVDAKNVFWSDAGDLVAIACEESFYILRYNAQAYINFVESGGDTGDGVEDAFEFCGPPLLCRPLIFSFHGRIKTGSWAGDCFIYSNEANRLNYLVGDEVFTISHFDKPMYLLGYAPRDNRVYVSDRDASVYSYSLSLAVIQYQTAVLRGDVAAATEILPQIPQDQHMKELALDVSTDLEQKFDLALQLGRLDTAVDIARQQWRTLGDVALQAWNFSLAEECLKNAKDLSGLLLFYTSNGNKAGLRQVAEDAVEQGKNNIAFTALYQLGELNEIIDLLIKTDRIPEAAIFARTYVPQQMSRVVKLWKQTLQDQQRTKIAESLADPEQYPNCSLNCNW